MAGPETALHASQLADIIKEEGDSPVGVLWHGYMRYVTDVEKDESGVLVLETVPATELPSNQEE